jgi:hypothetical protein
MNEWVLKYVGTQPQSCAHLALDIQQDIFGRSPNIGLDKFEYENREKILEDVGAYGIFETEVLTGDIVLMSGRSRNDHIGTVIINNGEPHVLHFLNNVGVSCTNLRWLKVLPGLNIEGYYRLK